MILVENGYYHIYNLGVEKRRIFEESQDYQKFLSYLNIYLTPVDTLRQENPLLRTNLINGNLSEQIEMIAFCLMPNHFHLLLKQKNKDVVTKLMRQINTAYSMYFNKKYDRIGPLFQGIYKACTVDNKDYLLYLSRYIHQKPRQRGISLVDFQWSSFSSYLGNNKHPWLKPKEVLEHHNATNPNLTYKKFVEESDNIPSEIQSLTLD